MAAKVGTAPVQFFQGANPVSAYLGATPIARTMYFDAAEDTDWATLGNWWMDSGHTVAATALPTAGDSVIASGNITDNTGDPATVVNLTMTGATVLDWSVNVTGMATFNGSSSIAGEAGSVSGNATFNDNSALYGCVSGNATFNDNSGHYSGCGVGGNATFTGSACLGAGGVVGGTVTGDPPTCPE